MSSEDKPGQQRISTIKATEWKKKRFNCYRKSKLRVKRLLNSIPGTRIKKIKNDENNFKKVCTLPPFDVFLCYPNRYLKVPVPIQSCRKQDFKVQQKKEMKFSDCDKILDLCMFSC